MLLLGNRVGGRFLGGVLILALVGCTPATGPTTTGATTSTEAVLETSAPATATTTAIPTTTTFPTHALAYPEVAISVRPLREDETSYAIWTRAERSEDSAVPEFVYGNDFTPSNMDLDPPRPVRFTNSTEDDIVIIFSAGDLEDLPVAAGGTQLVDFTSLPEEIYRFHVFRGNAKISGFIDMRSLESSIEPIVDNTPVRQAPFNGRFSIEVPTASSWYFNPQYDSVVAVPIADDWVQGDFQWSLATGAPLLSSGMRLTFSDLGDPDAILQDPVVPENCTLAGSGEVERSGLSGMQSEYHCDWATLYLGYLEAGESHLTYAFSDATTDPAEIVAAALDTIEVHPDGSGVPLTDRALPVHVAYSWLNELSTSFRYFEDDEPYPLDIEGGDISARLAASLTVLAPTAFELKNWDDVSYQIEINGGKIVDLAPHHAVTLDVTDFGEESVHITISLPPFVGYGLTLDLTAREPGPPEIMHYDTGRVRRETVLAELGSQGESLGIQALELDVPTGWIETGDRTVWQYRYARQAAENDPAEVDFRLAASTWIQYLLEEISIEARTLPEEVDRVVIRGVEWTAYQWAPSGHPTVTLLLIEDDGYAIGYAKLTSAPEDHRTLYEQALLPLVRELTVIPAESAS